MYHYWLHSFKMAKNWGVASFVFDTNTSLFWQDSPANNGPSGAPSPIDRVMTGTNSPVLPTKTIAQPAVDNSSSLVHMSSLCYWTVHVSYSDVVDEYYIPTDNGMQNQVEKSTLSELLEESLKANNFSPIAAESLPLSIPVIVNSITKSSSGMFRESFGLAIMTRNQILLEQLVNEAVPGDYYSDDYDDDGDDDDGDGSLPFLLDQAAEMFPFHLAATYLDGARTCCTIYNLLSRSGLRLRNLYVNNSGHTLLDSLMLTILRSHSSCRPRELDASFQNEDNFRGEEVDICGRWDADSPMFQQLLANGVREVPFSWKHKFCHTSAQAVCHVILLTFAHPYHVPPDINRHSGLCLTHCSACGLRMELLPLHVIVIVAHKLTVTGMPDEDLFGVLAITLCLLSMGADPSRKMNIPFSLFQEVNDETACNHDLFTPAELCQTMMYALSNSTTHELRNGWTSLHWILESSANEWVAGEPQSENNLSNSELETVSGGIKSHISCGFWCERIVEIYHNLGNYSVHSHPEGVFGSNSRLATLWAAVQTELLTYRRLKEGDPWVSSNFAMSSIALGLDRCDQVDSPLATKNMMKPFCRCGRFVNHTDPQISTLTDVSKYYFANLDGKGATYLGVVGRDGREFV
jgi:hypothetical protein